jgi:hypothetical protein
LNERSPAELSIRFIMCAQTALFRRRFSEKKVI